MSYVQVDRGVKLFYQDWGMGPVILFVHGWLQSHRAWDYQTNDLSNRFRTITYDLRGHGESDKPCSLYTYSEYAMDLYNLMLMLNLCNVTLVGWSLGSGIITEYLRLFGSERVSKFVSVGGTIPKMLSDKSWPYGLSTEFYESAYRGLHYTRAEFQRNFEYSAFVRKTVGNDTKEWLWINSMQTSLPAAVRTIISVRDADFRAFIPFIRIPFALFQGAKDQLTSPEAAMWIMKNNPAAKLVMFEESGHSPFIEEIDKFNKELERFVLGI